MEERNSYRGLKLQNVASGNTIRDLRKKSNLTQEKTAYGICSVQKYSRIESGVDIPTELEFLSLMNRFKKSGLYYRDLYKSKAEERFALRARIHDEAMLENWDKVCEFLYEHYQRFPAESPEDNQFTGFYETVQCFIVSGQMDGLTLSQMCHDLLVLSRPVLRTSHEINFIPTQLEFLLINAASVGLSEYNDPVFYKKAHSLFLTLLLLNKKRFMPDVCRNTRIGLLLNLCIIETEHGDYYSAQNNLKLLFQNCAYTGGSYLYSKALLCKASLLEKTGHRAEASDLLHSMSSVFHIDSEKSHNKVLVF